MKKYDQRKLYSFVIGILLMISALVPGCVNAMENSNSVMVVNHVVSHSFSRDGDYYTPTGRILFTVNKNEFPTIETLDELYTTPRITKADTKINIYLFNLNQGKVVSAFNCDILPIPRKFEHITATWNLANKPAGNYMFSIFLNGKLVSSYGITITD